MKKRTTIIFKEDKRTAYNSERMWKKGDMGVVVKFTEDAAIIKYKTSITVNEDIIPQTRFVILNVEILHKFAEIDL